MKFIRLLFQKTFTPMQCDLCNGWICIGMEDMEGHYFLLWYKEHDRKIICEECAKNLKISRVKVTSVSSKKKELFVEPTNSDAAW